MLMHAEPLKFRERSRMLQFGAYVFDVSVSEILTTLVCGKCICIPSEDERLGHLEDFITRAQVDWAFLTPTVARLINPDNVPSLKTLLQGGEFVGQDNVAKWSSRLQLIITAGPSETTIYSTHRLVKDPASRADNLGYAVGGVHWLVDPSNPDRIVSIGEIGEILTEGPIVSQGYLRNPAATSAAFIAAPRWYRSKDKSNGVQPQFYLTGDLARLNATDGTLRIAGRKGMQVKVRGQRMELQEIEHVLNQHHLVDHVVVMLVTEGPFKNRLVGVFSAVASQGYCQSLLGLELCTETKHVSKATSSLEDWLTERLPRNMVPSTWLCLKTLPRTTNGKLDRVRLKHWLHDLNEEGSILISAACRQSVTEIHEPKTPKEWKLCKIWASVLNMDEGAIGTNQSFYRLGGDSISALKVMTESRKSGIKITVQDLLREKTVSRLATVAQDIESDDRQSSDLSLMQDNGPFELTAIQQLHVIRDPDLTCRTNQSVLVQLQDGIHRQTVIDALRTIMAKHHMLRAQFRRNDSGNWIQEIKSEEAYALRLDSISVGTTAELEAAILDCQKTISVAANINMAAGLFTMGSRYLLFVTASHMVVDLVSWRIILDDLEEYLIKQRIDHRTTSSYQQWSHKQALMAIEYAKSGQISKYDLHKPSDDDHKFWKFWSDSAIENNEADAINSRVTLSTHHTSLILGQANNAYDTAPVELIIAAVLHSFAMVFPERGLPAMYFEGHGRQTTDPIIDLSRTVGWFTTMTPVRATFRQLDKLVRQIKDIRASTQDGGLAQFCHQILSTGREYIRLPFELLFNYAGMFQQLERADAVLREPQNLNAALQDLSMELPRFSLFAVEAGVSDGKLNMELIYNRHIRHQDRVLRWVETCLETLRTIAETFPHNLQKVSLYQFPRFSGSYDELDRLAQVALSHCGLSTLDSISDLSPASPMQEYMRAAESLRPGLLNSHFAFAIHGLDCQGDALRKTIDTAWQQVVNKHDILRTVFVNDPSKVHTTWQVVLKEFRTEVREATVIRDDCLQALMAEPPVPYCEGIPHHRLTLYHDPSGPAFCVLDISHALSDGGSKAPLFADLSSALGGSLGTSPGIGYAAASSQISQLHQMSYAFWEAYTRALEPCHLVPDNSATGFSHLQAGKAVPIPAEEKLKNLCANEGFTLGNLFMAAWTIMLAIYTDSTAVCFNYISAGRDQPVQEINSAIGPYFNMLISKAIVRDDMSLLDVINAAKDDFLDTLPHHGVSLPAVERHCSKNLTNLCNTTVNFRKFVSSDGNHIVNSNHGQIFVKELQTSAQPVVSFIPRIHYNVY
jgi:acyl carrier protein